MTVAMTVVTTDVTEEEGTTGEAAVAAAAMTATTAAIALAVVDGWPRMAVKVAIGAATGSAPSAAATTSEGATSASSAVLPNEPAWCIQSAAFEVVKMVLTCVA
eukprot:TRINITY_DN20857_c1_g1_i6.p3 TRINITY_DN20857_c1_g1~~TRINITY_DN20857_c1_g1_i6.p3  ORF type:complete len:104 (+),score=11.83 TRINITY_DN20857_c1_g1_i6:270-581(+)